MKVDSGAAGAAASAALLFPDIPGPAPGTKE